jgi:hypothetical protein
MMHIRIALEGAKWYNREYILGMIYMGRDAFWGAWFSPIVLLAALVVVLSSAGLLSVGAAAADTDGRVYDRTGVASFVPPERWVKWDFWGITAFSPTTAHEPRLTFSVTDETPQEKSNIETVMTGYVRTFSTKNYTLINKEYLYLGGYSGVRLLVQGTEKNKLFAGDYIWIQEYHTPRHKVTLIFHSEDGSFETYRSTVLTSFRSLIITETARDE